MNFLPFGRTKASSKYDIVKSTKDLLLRQRQESQTPKAEDELCKNLSQMKLTLQGTQETDSSPPAVQALVTDMLTHDFLLELARSIHLLRFESRKDSQTILSYALRFRAPGSTDEDPLALAHVIDERPECIIALCRGYEHRESAMPCGAVLREILKVEHVAAVVLYDESSSSSSSSEEGQGAGAVGVVRVNSIDFEKPASGVGVFWRFFGWIDNAAFEASTDAFSTFRELLTRHKGLVANYLDHNFELFFGRYNDMLIQSKSYVTKRQSIKLLGELLLDRANYSIMMKYVDKGEHLKLCMNLLRDERKMVQYEGFHVFKVFVANPNKSDAVRKILTQNRDRLLRFLPGFLDDRTDDDQFLDEKSFLIRQIELLPAPG